MIDPTIVLVIATLLLYVTFGVVFKFRWLYHLATLAGYCAGICGTGMALLFVLM